LKGAAEISPEDAARLHLKGEDRVRISSPHGSIRREVTIKKDIRPGLVFTPMAFHDNDARQLIALTELGYADSPGWKMCDVNIEKIEN